ncbi:MAG: peptide/nickel transport system ATP-binding protein [Actinomycetota bacterium]|nr:peptide/nickel transport system ATP-binding protein [Actinomycetota bacterium]
MTSEAPSQAPTDMTADVTTVGEELASETEPPDDAILTIRDLNVTFRTEEGIVQAVRGINLDVRRGDVLGVVGESGSGKSVTMLAVLGLLPRSAKITGSARFHGEELIGRKPKELRQVRGAGISMIFQDPLSALNPTHRIGNQIVEAIRAHHPEMSKHAALERGIELLGLVGIPGPEVRVRHYPHEFSGGMRQRAMIAMAIANNPDVLIADEPTTALDVTIQAQILEVLQRVQKETNSAIVFITHDLGVIARIATRVHVMYAGRSAEIGGIDEAFERPRHPYTVGLLKSLPGLVAAGERLTPIGGSPPSMLHPPSGCAFHPRCPMAQDVCREQQPPLRLIDEPDHKSACHFAEQVSVIAETTP